MGAACGSNSQKSVGAKGSSDPGTLSYSDTKLLESKRSFQKRFSDQFKNSSLVVLDAPWRSSTSREDIDQLYKFTEVIGEGFSGKVTKAMLRTYPKKMYAVKSIRKSTNSDKQARYFRTELDILKRLDHPNIVQFFECYQDQKHFHLVLELCEGNDLVKLVETRRGLPEHLLKKFFFQAVYAINYLHYVGIVHRDIKLDNFLLSTRDEDSANLKLIDFGFARSFRDYQLTSQVGTPWYVAPEVIKKVTPYSQKCDNWSLGVLLYMMMFAEPPFKGRSNGEVFLNIKEEELDFNQQKFKAFNPDLLAILSGLLKKDPDQRMSLSQVLQSRWFDSKILELHGGWSSSLVKTLIKRMKTIKKAGPFRREVMKMMVKVFSDDPSVIELGKIFQCCDCVNNGVITQFELNILFEEAGVAYTEPEILKIIDNFFLQTENVISYTEFIAGMIDKSFFTNSDRLKMTFERFDIDKSGFITRINIRDCFERFGYSISEELSKCLIGEFDMCRDGVVSFEEFIKMMKHKD